MHPAASSSGHGQTTETAAATSAAMVGRRVFDEAEVARMYNFPVTP
jgi:hypothetical protein